MTNVSGRHRRTLQQIFVRPTSGTIPWSAIESLLTHLGATIHEGAGSRIGVRLGDERGFFHRPHPEKEASKGAIDDVRRFLVNAGVKPDN